MITKLVILDFTKSKKWATANRYVAGYHHGAETYLQLDDPEQSIEDVKRDLDNFRVHGWAE